MSWKNKQKKHDLKHLIFLNILAKKERKTLDNSIKAEIGDFQECLKAYGPKTIHGLLSAFLIWLFGNLVFIPLASSLNWQTKILCTLVFFSAFTLLILRALPGLKKLIDAFSVFPARKFSLKKVSNYEDSLILSKNALHIIFTVIFYLSYFPFLMNFHPAINGIVLILVLIWIFFLVSRVLLVLSPKILKWFYT